MHEVLARENFARDVGFLSPVFLQSRGWILNQVEMPILDVTFTSATPLRVRLRCDEWDELPPSVELLKVDGGAYVEGLKGPVFHKDSHPIVGRSWVCMVGYREYHTYVSHVTDVWAAYRGQDGMNLSGLLDRLNRAWRKEMGI